MSTKTVSAIYLEGHSQDRVTFSTTAGQSAVLPEGAYDVISDVDCYIKVAGTADDVTTLTGYPLSAGNMVTVHVRNGRRIGVIGASAGTLKVHRVSN